MRDCFAASRLAMTSFMCIFETSYKKCFTIKSSRRFSDISFIRPCGILFMNYPDYSYPPVLFARVARDVVLLRCRDFRQDAKACIANINPPLQVSGKENIPQQGPCVLTVNHYHRAGFGAQW